MATVLGFVWFIIGWMVTHTAILVWASLMMPQRVERARQRAAEHPVANFFRGLAVGGVTLVIVGALVKEGNPGPLQLLGWILAGPTLAGGIIGGAGIARIVASRIRPLTRSDSEMQSLVAGAFCTALAAWVPIVGWFVFTPVVGLMAIGAGFPSLFQRVRKQNPAVDPMASPVQPSGQAPVQREAERPRWETDGLELTAAQAGTGNPYA